MESNHELDPRRLLIEAEAASAAPYLDYPKLSGWFAVAAGAWVAALVFVLTANFDRPAIMIPAIAVLLGIEAAWISSYRRKWGTFPTIHNAPAEVRRVYVWYFIGVGVAVAASALAYVAWGAAGATIASFVTVSAGIGVYERFYNRAADADTRSAGDPVSVHDLDPIIHAPKRLAAMAILAHSVNTDFAFLRSHLEVSDSDLSKQMAALERPGYVSVSKSGRGRGATTTFAITATGRQAYNEYLAALRAITNDLPALAT